MRTVKKIAIILIGIVTSVILVPKFIFFAIYFICYIVYECPDVPVIKEAEFPFELVYEYNGNVFEIDDVYVCEYDGINMTEGGKFLNWSGYYKSSNEEDLTIIKDDKIEVGINIGSVRYYMGVPGYSAGNIPSAYRITRNDNGGIYGEPLSDEKLYSEYGIRIISWELSDPIQNTFVPKKWYEFWK